MREGIEQKSLSFVCTKITDGSHFSPKEDEDGAYPMLSVKDMMSSGFEYTACKYINECDYKVLVANGCKPNVNDVLVAKDGSYLKTAFVLKEDREQAVLSSIAIITPRLDIINPDYLAFFFKAPNTKAVVEKHYLTGTAIKRIILKGFRSIRIPIPPLSEQERIVSELDLLSSIIEKKKEQLKAYDQLAQSIFYDMFGDPIENPKGWEVKKLGEVCYHITDGDHMPPPKADKGIPFLTIANIDKDKKTLDFNNTFFVPQNYYDNLKEERKPRINDILYTVTGSYGIPVIVRTACPFCFQRHIALLRPIQEKILTSFLFNWALCSTVKEEADKVATGIAQKTVGLNSLRQFVVILPPLSLQQSFADKIESIEHQKSLIQQSIKEVQTMFDSRMDYYFN